VITSTILRLAPYIAKTEEDKSAFKISTGKPLGKRSIGGLRRRMHLKGIGDSTKNWMIRIRIEIIGESLRMQH
jgi:hypothetical protein